MPKKKPLPIKVERVKMGEFNPVKISHGRWSLWVYRGELTELVSPEGNHIYLRSQDDFEALRRIISKDALAEAEELGRETAA